MQRIQWGVELVKSLASTGTGEAKIDIARKVIADTWEHERRHATAEEVFTAMDAAGVGEGTMKKARSFIDTGTPYIAERAAPKIEDVLPPPPAEPKPGGKVATMPSAPLGQPSELPSPVVPPPQVVPPPPQPAEPKSGGKK